MADNEKIENEVIEESEATETASDAEVKKTTKSEKKDEEKKPGFFKRLAARLKKFWKNYKSELKKITWYSRKQTFHSTLIVLVCMVAAAVFIGVLDFGFSKGIEGLGALVELIR